MNLDISTIPVEHVALAWLSPLCAVNKPEKLMISKEQSEKIFSNTVDANRWGWYRGVRLIII